MPVWGSREGTIVDVMLRWHPAIHLVLLVVVGTILGACGHAAPKPLDASRLSSAPTPDAGTQVIARVGSVPITRDAVNHWMQALAGSDYSEASHAEVAPQGLVSDPPDYRRCVSVLDTLARRSPSHAAAQATASTQTQCRQLYQALRTQATSLLVSAIRVIEIGREQGVVPSDHEVAQYLKRYKAEEYGSEANFLHALAAQGWSRTEILLEARVNVVSNGLLARYRAPQGHAHYIAAERRWLRRISCQAGYVVEYCKNYTGGATYPDTSSPSVLMEQVAAMKTGRCINLAACGKLIGK